MGFRGGFRVLLCDWTRREPKGTRAESQRAHVARAEAQAATTARAARKRRPITTVVADVEERTIIAAA